ncbi:MAG TPA: hypothetical protein VLH84_00645 [Patescibacteria group bacterium]|nr:hypothetical protein [Patescibacteria group bacterium]
MRHASSATEQRSGSALVPTYITYIGHRERPNLELAKSGKPERPHHASLLIGAGCLLLVDGRERKADRMLRSVRDGMDDLMRANSTSAQGRWHAATLRHIAAMLLWRDNPTSATTCQLAIHREAVRAIRSLRPAAGGAPPAGDVTGALAEQNANGLATRSAGIGTLTLPALYHHDMGPTVADNYDLLVIDCGSGPNPKPSAHRAQLKNVCMGFCGDETFRATGEEVRGRYKQDIVLVSQHCDITVPAGEEGGEITNLLLAEASDPRAPIRRAPLDTTTLHLLETIIEPEPWRMGTQPIGALALAA